MTQGGTATEGGTAGRVRSGIRWLRGAFAAHPVRAAGTTLAVLLGFGAAGLVTVAVRADPKDPASWRPAPGGSLPAAAGAQPSTSGSTNPSPDSAAKVISLAATGDIVMGDAPGNLPANGGRDFFAAARPALAADLVMGNLEEPLTADNGYIKCRASTAASSGHATVPVVAAPAVAVPAGAARPAVMPPAVAAPAVAPSATAAGSSGCHQFRAPPSYAQHLRDAGFDLLNLANNHAYDYGAAGNRSTRAALEKYGLRHTGGLNEITVVPVNGVKVAVLGFSSYFWSNSLVDIAAAKKVVQRAAGQADLVVVQVHMGAEGSDKIHVRPGTEMFLGENRGDPVKFSHAVIDAGADLVIGHGPHVLRPMEFYRGRLIAYSLGNFAGGGGTLSNSGRLGLSAVLKVSLRADGGFAGGQLISVRVGGGGRPAPDPGKGGLALVRSVCKADFPRTEPKWGTDGQLAPS